MLVVSVKCIVCQHICHRLNEVLVRLRRLSSI